MKNYIFTFLVCFLAFNQTAYLQEQDSNIKNQDHVLPTEEPKAPSSFDSIYKDLPDPSNDRVLTHSEASTDDFQSKFVHMLFLLGLLIAFMLLASWLIKRLMKSRLNQINTTSSIKVLETRPLSPKSTVYLLDIMGEGIVIAESGTGVHYLATIPLEYENDDHEDRYLER